MKRRQAMRTKSVAYSSGRVFRWAPKRLDALEKIMIPIHAVHSA